ncbi:hypothetical protein BOTBODRAFT_187989 [Botryobasidium botryosum FD-172 SS1]|uniref:MYND-type domain-containing protein n=1 Tax=Botryobasidium botryosum (strain FD-172 SS1) TaxID=930990 RepID=A0A067MRB1_BOTB1|nr:hypothetical protein BOTBODRAFT_187989 [Botryobasidium botryosum FD-172 SS1]
MLADSDFVTAARTLTSMASDFRNRKEDRKYAKVTCSYCNKESEAGKLATCSRCRSVRYCNASCQRLHFRASHRADCENFKDPPITDLFNVRNRPGTSFPVNPVFAEGSRDGVGCWVSIGDNIACMLQTILCPTMALPSMEDRYTDEQSKAVLEKQEGHERNIITLRILVQNRRKDRQSVVIYPALAMIAAAGSTRTGRALKFWQDFGDDVEVRPISPTLTFCSTSTFKDPWGIRRASVLSVNGVQYPGNDKLPRSSTLPSAAPLNKIKDPPNGVVALGYGDYAVFELQFRCAYAADKVTAFEFQPLFDIAALFLLTADLKDFAGPQGPSDAPPKCTAKGVIAVPFDQGAIQAYYADYMREGPLAHMDTHYVDSRLGETPLETLRNNKTALRRFKQIEKNLGPGAVRKGQDIMTKLLRGAPLTSHLSVRYCDATCQRKHFSAFHKADCKNFKDPPFTDYFNVRNRPGLNYPPAPIFAKVASDGVGCWVSAGCTRESALQRTIDPTWAYDSEGIIPPTNEGSRLLAEHKGLQRSLLTVQVLAQNRSKDPIIMAAGRMVMIGTKFGSKRFREWECPGHELQDFPMGNTGETRVGASVFKDAWGIRRSSVLSVNGVPYLGNKTFPRSTTAPPTPPLDKIKDPANGIVVLSHGDYAVLELQFRCGDGESCNFDINALVLCDCLMIPWMPWDGRVTASEVFMRMTPSALVFEFSHRRMKALCAPFDSKAIISYYEDFATHGLEGHLRTHFGDAQASSHIESEAMIESMRSTLVSQMRDHIGEDLLKTYKERWMEDGLEDHARLFD